jgi:hypothetical protein
MSEFIKIAQHLKIVEAREGKEEKIKSRFLLNFVFYCHCCMASDGYASHETLRSEKTVV